jgi:TonB family protein
VEVAASSGYAVLDTAAQEAVKQWTHTPALRNGTPVTSWMTLNCTFTLDNKAEANR